MVILGADWVVSCWLITQMRKKPGCIRQPFYEFRQTLVKRGATLGANSTIVCGVTIGEYAMVGAGAVITWDVRPHALMLGVPARQADWVCRCGTTLPRNDDTFACPECGECYQFGIQGQLELLA